MIEPKFPEIHIFVCINDKEKGECCAQKGMREFHSLLKERIKSNPKARDRVRVNKAGCLDQCQFGGVVVIYPKKKWFLNLKSESDIEKIVNEVESLL